MVDQPWWLIVPAATSLVITLLFHGTDLEGSLGLMGGGAVQFVAVALVLSARIHHKMPA